MEKRKFNIVEIDKNFGISPKPIDREDVDLIAKAGFKTVISMTPVIPEIADALKKRGIKHVQKFIHGFYDAPSYAPYYSDLLKNFDGKTLVHCIAGFGTSRCFAVAYFVNKGVAVPKAIELVKSKAGPFNWYEADRAAYAELRKSYLRQHTKGRLVLYEMKKRVAAKAALAAKMRVRKSARRRPHGRA